MYYVFDSDGNPVGGEHSSVDEAILAAARAVIGYAVWERVTVSCMCGGQDVGCDVAAVQRLGWPGSRRVRVSFAGAEWIGMEIEVAS